MEYMNRLLERDKIWAGGISWYGNYCWWCAWWEYGKRVVPRTQLWKTPSISRLDRKEWTSKETEKVWWEVLEKNQKFLFFKNFIRSHIVSVFILKCIHILKNHCLQHLSLKNNLYLALLDISLSLKWDAIVYVSGVSLNSTT